MKRKETSASSALDTPPCSTPCSVTKNGAGCALGLQQPPAAAAGERSALDGALQPAAAYELDGFGSSATLSSIAQVASSSSEPVAVSLAGFSALDATSALLWTEGGVGDLSIGLANGLETVPPSTHATATSGAAHCAELSASAAAAAFLHLSEPSPLIALSAPQFAPAMTVEQQQQTDGGIVTPALSSAAAQQSLFYNANLNLNLNLSANAEPAAVDGFAMAYEPSPLMLSTGAACSAQRANSTGVSPVAAIAPCFTFASNAADSSCGSLDAAPYSNAESVSAHSASSQASSLCSQAASNGVTASSCDATRAVSKSRSRVKRPRLVFTEAQRAELMVRSFISKFCLYHLQYSYCLLMSRLS